MIWFNQETPSSFIIRNALLVMGMWKCNSEMSNQLLHYYNMSVNRVSFHTNRNSGVIKPHFNNPFFTLSSLVKKEVDLIVLNMLL